MRAKEIIRVISRKLGLIILLLVGFIGATPAQEDSQSTDNKADSSLKSMARVNPSTLAMEFSIPLANYPGRGGNSLPVQFYYSSKVWRMVMSNYHTQTIAVSGHQDYTHESHETTSVRPFFSIKSNSGWTTSLQPVMLIAPRDVYEPSGRMSRFTIDLSAFLEVIIPANSTCFQHTEVQPDLTCSSGLGLLSAYMCYGPDDPFTPAYVFPASYTCVGSGEPGGPPQHGPATMTLPQPQKIWRLQVRFADGSMHEFRKDNKIHSCSNGPSECASHPNGTYLSTESSGMRIQRGETQADDSVRDVLYLPDGGKYIFPAYTGSNIPLQRMAQKFIDKNGNFSTYDYATKTWIDTLGRSISDPMPSRSEVEEDSDGIMPFSLKGIDENPRAHSTVWADLEDVLENSATTLKQTGQETGCFNTGVNSVSGGVLFPSSATGAPYETILDLNATVMHIRRERTCTEGIFNPKVLSKVTLPNLKYYEFKYNEYGEITKIIYPSGAFERFEYQTIPMLGGNVREIYSQGNRGVHTRYISFDGTGIDQTWTYQANDSQGYKVTITAPDSSYTVRTIQDSGNSSFSFENPIAGAVLEERAFDASLSHNLRSRTLTKWITKIPDDGDSSTTVDRDARVEKTVTIQFEPNSGNALATMTKLEYDENGSTDPTYFSHLNLKRKTTYHYAVITNKTTVDDEALTWSTIDSWFPDTKKASITETDYWYSSNHRARGIIGLPTEARTLNPANTSEVLSKTTLFYDNWMYTESGTAAQWTDPSSIWRGNVTITRNWLKDPVTQVATDIDIVSQYDKFGNLRKAWDAAGNMTETVYEDTYQKPYKFAYPTKMIAPAPDPMDTHGANLTSTVDMTYDFTTGLPKEVQDEYAQIIKTEYDDPMLRPTKVFPYNFTGPETQTIYDNDAHTVKVRKRIDEQNWDEATTYMDAAGRTLRTEAKDSQGNIIVNTHYDLMGRIDCVTSPYRSGEAAYWNKIRFDEIGRTVEKYAPIAVSLCQTQGQTLQSLGTTSFDFSTVANYEGTVVITNDASERKGRSITNALGQLLRVDEPTAFGGTVTNDLGTIDVPNQPTYYTYSKLGQLIKVQQGKAGETIQYRYFLYDNLGRLLRVKQPEQEANTGLPSYTDPISGNSSWSAVFTYDVMGNILTATDAKGTVITNTYDNAGRVKKRSYSNEPQGIITPEVSYFYDGKGLTGTVNFAKGKLTKVSSSVSETRYTNFDHMGRVLSSDQVTDGQTYHSGYKYNLSGALTEQTYPSGEVVRNFIESDGDLSSVAVSGHNYASNFSYSSHGEVAQMRYGNGRWETAQFNTRRQLTQIGLGSDPNNTSLWKIAYEYGELQSDGISIDPAKNTGNIGKQTVTISGTTFIQTNKYDSLDRLTEAKERTNGQQNWIQQFGYDRYGNRTNFYQQISSLTTNTTPAIDLTSNRFSSGQGFVYDKNGNITYDGQGAGVRSFIFDGDNKQIQVKNVNGSPTGTYYYDGNGKRVKKVTDIETTVFVYDGMGKLIAEYSNQLSQTPTISYTTTDNLGSPRVITDKNGNVTSRRDFMPFGEELFAGTPNRTTAAKYSITGDALRKKFTGYEKDNETGLDFAEARYYDNQYGRFTAVDPKLASGTSVNPQTFNRYVYVGNNPIIRLDPNGLEWWEVRNKRTGERGYVWNEGKPDSAKYELIGQVTTYLYQGLDNRWYALDPKSENHFSSPDREGAFWQYGLYTDFNGDFNGLFDGNLSLSGAFNDIVAKDMMYLAAYMKTGNVDGALAMFAKISVTNALGIAVSKILGKVVASALVRFIESEVGQALFARATAAIEKFAANEAGSFTISKGTQVTTNGVQKALQMTNHAAQRMGERGITEKMIQVGIEKGAKFYDPKNGSIVYVLKNGFATGKDLLVARNPFTGAVTSVIRGKKLILKRFIPIE